MKVTQLPGNLTWSETGDEDVTDGTEELHSSEHKPVTSVNNVQDH